MPRDGAGNPVSSFGRGRLNDEIRASGKQPPVSAKSRPEGHQPDPDAEMQQESPEDIHDVVAEHGPAHGAHHKMIEDTHHVSTHHGADFVHHSRHQSHEEVHKHLGKAYGLASKEHEESETPGFEAEEEKAGIPGMA